MPEMLGFLVSSTASRSNASLLRLAAGVLAALASATALSAQAAVEYALQSSRGAVSAVGGDAAIGGCKVDSALLACLGRLYPKTMIVATVLLALFIYGLARRRRVY